MDLSSMPDLSPKSLGKKRKRHPHSNEDCFVIAVFPVLILGVASSKPDFVWDCSCTALVAWTLVWIVLGALLPTSPRPHIPAKFQRKPCKCPRCK